MTGTDLVYSSASLDQRKQYASALSHAGELLPKSLYETVRTDDGRVEQRPSAGKILLIAETGNMLGIHPIAALNGVNVIEGKPTVSPALMRALIQRAGHKVRVRETGTVEGGDYAVTVTIIRSDDPDNPHPAASTWTPHKAARAGLCMYALDGKSGKWKVTAQSRSGNPLPWQAYTEALCLARATREAANMGASDVIMGVYLHEELGAAVNADGELLDVTATVVDRTPPRAVAPDVPYEQDADGPAVTAVMQETHEPVPASKASKSAVKPSKEDEHAVADEWADRTRRTLTVTDARDLYKDAKHRGILEYATTTGELLDDVLRARGEELRDAEAQAEAGEPLPLPIPADEYPEPVF